jgi:orotidine-5'-phosphate decarboxylase
LRSTSANQQENSCVDFTGRLFDGIRRVGNPVVVGIDPRPEDLPPGYLDQFASTRAGISQALLQFGLDVIDVVAPLVPIVKFQCAFYEAYGPEGVSALHKTAEAAHARGLIVIIDGKLTPEVISAKSRLANRLNLHGRPTRSP